MRPLINIHGGKFYLKGKIIPHIFGRTYVECFLGGGSVLLNKVASINEVANDLNPDLLNLWLYCQSGKLYREVKNIRCSEEVFMQARDKQYPLEVCEYILRRMSRNGMKDNFSWSKRSRGGRPEKVNSWETAKEELPDLEKRIKYVKFLNMPAVDLIPGCGNDTCIYVDPPYLHSTRTSTKEYGKFEMKEKDHVELLEVIVKSNAHIIISGYDSPLYNNYLDGWFKYTFDLPNHSSQAKTKQRRTEVLWINE